MTEMNWLGTEGVSPSIRTPWGYVVILPLVSRSHHLGSLARVSCIPFGNPVRGGMDSCLK